jgi:hypothetical protein
MEMIYDCALLQSLQRQIRIRYIKFVCSRRFLPFYLVATNRAHNVECIKRSMLLLVCRLATMCSSVRDVICLARWRQIA